MADEAVNFTSHDHPVFRVTCPVCGQPAGLRCKNDAGYYRAPHRQRRKRAVDEIVRQGGPGARVIWLGAAKGWALRSAAGVRAHWNGEAA